MQMIKTPVNGMRDISLAEMEIRLYLLNKIRDVYTRFGFSEIQTPAVEHIENLLSKQGWDNEKLIFKILKRGEKLEKSLATGLESEIVDSGLRYDLTLPLCRYYANNRNDLPTPFKAMQIGNVYRADRPQKGRFREFCQCDIDILGEESNLAEIDLLLATSSFFKEINFKDFYFEINDRRILKALILKSGFKEEDFEKVCISLDKLDKINVDGVKKELVESGFPLTNASNLIDLSNKINSSSNIFEELKTNLSGFMDEEVINSLYNIVETLKQDDIDVRLNLSLVRGMGYYTGTIYEIKSEKLSSSLGGGGRYDEMVGNFIGVNAPASGISIGFERLITILMEDSIKIDTKVKKIAYLIEKNMPREKITEIINEAQAERKKGNCIYVSFMAKNKKFQKENLAKLGYTEFKDYYIERG